MLTLRDIEKLHKKPKADKETRLATAMVKELSLLHVEAYVQAVCGLQTILKNVALENGVYNPCVINNGWIVQMSNEPDRFYIICFIIWLLQAGRSDRKEFVKKRTKLNPHASTSNKEKKRTKNFMMMRQSQNVRTKGKRSFREKQVSCTSSIKFEISF